MSSLLAVLHLRRHGSLVPRLPRSNRRDRSLGPRNATRPSAYVFRPAAVKAFADSEQAHAPGWSGRSRPPLPTAAQLAAAYASRTSALTRPRSGTSQPFSRAQARMSAAETFAPSPAEEEAADERLPLLRRPPVRRA